MSEDILQKIHSVEHAIQQVETVKRQLNRNAPEVKNTITTSVSRQLEALRNREVWLLNQVDLIKCSKEEVLHHQLARLHKELGALQCLLNTAEGDEIMQSPNNDFDLCDLKPEETPYICFKADPISLRDAVMNYGRVDPNGLPVGGHFQDPRKPSASLPPQFEDYDDADHHVLYKTLEEIKQARTRNSAIEVKIPCLSSRPEDWLCRSSTVTSSSTSGPKFSFPAFSNNTTDWLKQPVTTEVSDSGRRPIMSLLLPCESGSSKLSASSSQNSSKMDPPVLMPPVTSNASITTWLQQIRNKDIEDEEDFEVVDSAGSFGTIETDDFLETKSTPVVLAPHSTCDLKLPVSGSNNRWLQSTSQIKTDVSSKHNNVFDSYFAWRDRSDSTWLCQDKTGSCRNGCATSSFPLEIENLGNCLSDKLWLKSEKKSVDTLKWLCKANEPCKSFSECLGKPSCLEEHQESIESTHTADLPGMRMFKHSASDSRNWLLNGGKNVEPPTKCPGFENFEQMFKGSSGWLKGERSSLNSSEPNITSADFHDKRGEVNQMIWLQQKHQDCDNKAFIKTSDTWQKVVNQHSQMSSDDQWLLPRITADKNDTTVFELDDEQWLLKKEEMECETPSKENIVTFPDKGDDYTKWLFQ